MSKKKLTVLQYKGVTQSCVQSHTEQVVTACDKFFCLTKNVI